MSDYEELLPKRDVMVLALATEVGEGTAVHLVDTLLERVRKVEEAETARPQLPPPVEEPDYLKYDGVDPSDPCACNCLGNGGACWHCYQGEHDMCTSDQHGRGSTKCTLGRTK